MFDAILAALPETIVDVLPELWVAIGETLLMLGIGLSAAVLLGGPLGIWLFLLSPGQSLQNRWLFAVVGWVVNMVRSFPFIILLVALVPFTRWLVGSSRLAHIVPTVRTITEKLKKIIAATMAAGVPSRPSPA